MAKRKVLRYIGTDNIVRYDERYANNGKFETIELDTDSKPVSEKPTPTRKATKKKAAKKKAAPAAVAIPAGDAELDDLLSGIG